MRAARHGTLAQASERTDRVLFLVVGFGGLVYLALALSNALSQAPAVRGPADIVLFAALALGCLMLTFSTWFSLRWLKAIAAGIVIAYSIGLIVWLPLQQGDRLPGAAGPWPLSLIAIATTCGLLAFPLRIAAPYLPVACLAGGVLRLLSDNTVSTLLAVEDTLFMLFICTMFAALLLVFLRASRARDTAMRAAAMDAQAHGEAQARAEQRARFGALVHDDVISTLLVAAHDDDSRRQSVRDYATRALRRIDEAASPARPEGEVLPSECAARLRAAAAVPSAPALRVVVNTTLPVPTSAVEALGEALGEALRNSLRHADVPSRPVHREATAVVSDAGVRVIVHDDGAGFSPQRVPPERLGLRVSVIARMNSISGTAVVDARPHEGTTITLVWLREGPGHGE